ncbi:hypothetical protein HBI65_000010 [Parastagonospora nodorum]|nr:hypothetical protein HBI65_000010 [Parastagonospora nodorum]
MILLGGNLFSPLLLRLSPCWGGLCYPCGQLATDVVLNGATDVVLNGATNVVLNGATNVAGVK